MSYDLGGILNLIFEINYLILIIIIFIRVTYVSMQHTIYTQYTCRIRHASSGKLPLGFLCAGFVTRDAQFRSGYIYPNDTGGETYVANGEREAMCDIHVASSLYRCPMPMISSHDYLIAAEVVFDILCPFNSLLTGAV